MAQCDTYTPAASAAKDAFEAAFPPSKQPEAIAFCKDEITSVSSWSDSVFFSQVFKGYRHIITTALSPGIIKERVSEVFLMEVCLSKMVFNKIDHF